MKRKNLFKLILYRKNFESKAYWWRIQEKYNVHEKCNLFYDQFYIKEINGWSDVSSHNSKEELINNHLQKT